MNNFKKIRNNKNQTLRDVATILGCSVPAVFKYEKGIRIPSPKFMKKIVEWSDGEIQPNDFYKEVK